MNATLRRKAILLLPVFALLGILAACGGDTAPAASGGAAPAAAGASDRLLDDDLPDAVGVLEAKQAEDGATVEVWGRVRQVANGVFTLVDDEEVAYCGKEGPDKCRTPWDYCCENPEQVAKATLVVEVRDEAGKDVPAAAFGLRPVDLVALAGRVTRTDAGEVVLIADGRWYRRERPDLPDFVDWP